MVWASKEHLRKPVQSYTQTNTVRHNAERKLCSEHQCWTPGRPAEQAATLVMNRKINTHTSGQPPVPFRDSNAICLTCSRPIWFWDAEMPVTPASPSNWVTRCLSLSPPHALWRPLKVPLASGFFIAIPQWKWLLVGEVLNWLLPVCPPQRKWQHGLACWEWVEPVSGWKQSLYLHPSYRIPTKLSVFQRVLAAIFPPNSVL